MKKFKILAVIAAMLVLCFAFVACENKDDGDQTKKEKVFRDLEKEKAPGGVPFRYIAYRVFAAW